MGAVLLAASPLLGAPRSLTILDQKMVITPHVHSLKLCVDEKRSVVVLIDMKITYRRSSDRIGTTRTMTQMPVEAVRVLATVEDPSVAVVAPQFETSPPGLGLATFTVTGTTEGTTSLRLRDDLGRAGARVAILVQQCQYTISATSAWDLRFGFNPNLYSRIPDTTLVRTGPGTYEAAAMMQNQAVGDTIQGCVPTFTPAPSRVHIKGTLQGSGTQQLLVIQISYDTINVGIVITCPKGGSGRSNTGSITTLVTMVDAFPTSTVSRPFPGHELATQGGTANSDTRVIVSMVRGASAP